MSRKSTVLIDIWQDENNASTNITSGGHRYICRLLGTREVWYCDKLPPILKMLRKRSEDTYFAPRIPHGNRVRTDILETGVCRIEDSYEITIERW